MDLGPLGSGTLDFTSGMSACKVPRELSPTFLRALKTCGETPEGEMASHLRRYGLASTITLGNLDEEDCVVATSGLSSGACYAFGRLRHEARMACRSRVAERGACGMVIPPQRDTQPLPTRNTTTASASIPSTSSFLFVSGSSVGTPVLPATTRTREDDRKLAILDGLMKIFRKEGADGSKWSTFAALSVSAQKSHIELWKEQLATTSVGTLAAALGTWKRWRADLSAWGRPDGPQPEHVVAQWLRGRRERGPTAAKGVLRSLAWLELHLGLTLHTASPLVRNFGSVASGHIESPQEPLPLIYWFRLTLLTNSDNAFVRVLAVTWLGLTQACLRFAHW